MNLFSLPDPVSIIEGAATAKLERETLNSLVSSSYSAEIAFLWRLGQSKLAKALGIGQAFSDAATVQYLTLRKLEAKGFLTLTVPQDMIKPGNLSQFQTEQQVKT